MKLFENIFSYLTLLRLDQADTKIYFLVGKQTSNATKLLDFLHFNLTNPRVRWSLLGENGY